MKVKTRVVKLVRQYGNEVEGNHYYIHYWVPEYNKFFFWTPFKRSVIRIPWAQFSSDLTDNWFQLEDKKGALSFINKFKTYDDIENYNCGINASVNIANKRRTKWRAKAYEDGQIDHL